MKSKGLIKKILPVVAGSILAVGIWGYGMYNWKTCEKIRKDYPIVIQSAEVRRTLGIKSYEKHKDQFSDEIKKKIEFYNKYSDNGYGNAVWLYLISSGLLFKGARNFSKKLDDFWSIQKLQK